MKAKIETEDVSFTLSFNKEESELIDTKVTNYLFELFKFVKMFNQADFQQFLRTMNKDLKRITDGNKKKKSAIN